jgi:hypothetical protein
MLIGGILSPQSNPGEGGLAAFTTGLYFSQSPGSSSAQWSIDEREAWPKKVLALKMKAPISPIGHLPGWINFDCEGNKMLP